MNNDDKQAEEDAQRVRAAIDSLSEHFDSVHIFVSRRNGDRTETYDHGCGNWFTRWGHILSWIDQHRERARLLVAGDGP